MKKFLATLLAGFMLCMSLPAFALTPEDFETAMNEQFDSAQVKVELKAEVTELDLDVLKNITGADLTALPSAKLGYDMVMITSQDMKKMQMKMDMTMETVPAVPLLDKTIATSYVDFDMTDAENVKYRMTTKTPESEKYQVLDFMKLPNADAMMEQVLKMQELLTPEKVAELNEQMNAYLPEIKKEYKDNSEIITLNDAQIKEVVAGAFKAMKEVMLPMMNPMLTVGNVNMPGVDMKQQMEASEKKFNDIFAAAKDVKLFAEDGLVATTTLDPKTKQIASMDCVIKVDTNLNELISKVIKAAGATDEEVAANLEKVPADKSDFKGQVSMNIAFSQLNDKDLKVEFPVLTDENSEDLTEAIIGGANGSVHVDVVDINAVNVFYMGKKVDFKDVQPVIENDRTLVPIRHFCNALGISDDDIQYDDGIVTIKNGDTTITLTIDQQDYIIEKNGETKNGKLDVPATEQDGRTLVPLRFISENFGCDVSFEEFTDASGAVTGSRIDIVPSVEK